MDDSTFSESLKNSIELANIVNKYNIPREAHRDLVRFINRAYKGKRYVITYEVSRLPLILTFILLDQGMTIEDGEAVERQLKNKVQIEAHEYDVCMNGCKLFGPENEEDICPYCHESRYADVDNSKACATMKILSIGDCISKLLSEEGRRSELKYRVERVSEPGVLKDFFDGEAYKTFQLKGEFLGEDDVAVALFTDGFTNQNTRGNDFTIVHAIILNYDPSIRYITNVYLILLKSYINFDILDTPIPTSCNWLYYQVPRSQWT